MMVYCNTSVDCKMCRYNRNNRGMSKDNIDVVVPVIQFAVTCEFSRAGNDLSF